MPDRTRVEDVQGVTSASSVGLGDSDPLPVLDPPLVAGDLGAFGGYRVLGQVGRGGMGVVYKAIDPTLGRVVALKVMLPKLVPSEVARRRFLREARAVAAIRHDNVVTIFQEGESAHPFFAMEFLTGRVLEDRFAAGPLPVADAVRVGREVAEALAAAHAAGIVHRDVKPGNIWLADLPGGGFRTKLLDFGLARVSEGDDPITQTGALLGTLAYMAPEQARGAVEPRSDLYSLGAVLYQLLAGRLPFDRQTTMQLLTDSAARAQPPLLTGLVPGLPLALAALVHALLEPYPSARPESAERVAADLRAVEVELLFGGVRPLVAPPAEFPEHDAPTLAEGARSSDTLPVRPPAPPPGPARPARRPLWAALALAALAGAAALVALWPRPRPDEPPAPPAPPAPAPGARRQPPALAPAPRPKRFELFNGTNWDGWHPPAGTPSNGWSVAGGQLIGTPMPTGSQWLLSADEYGDVDLRVTYRWLEPRGHTSIAFRVHEAPNDPERVLGLRVNLRDEDTLPGGEPELPLYRTGGLYMVQTAAVRAARPAGEWNELRVVVRGQRVRIEHNGALTVDTDLDRHSDKVARVPALKWPKGRIGLCSHVWAPIAYGSVTVGPP